MPQSYRIRKATPADYPAVAALEQLLIDLHRQAWPDYFRHTSYPPAAYTALLARPVPIAWAAEAEGQVVGICFGSIAEIPENDFCQPRLAAVIEDLAVFPSHRGRGIAGALLQAAREQAAQAGAAALELCVWDFNQDALRLYQSLGFTPMFRRRGLSLP